MTMVEEVNLVVGLVAAVAGVTVFMMGFGLTFKGPERLEPVVVLPQLEPMFLRNQ